MDHVEGCPNKVFIGATCECEKILSQRGVSAYQAENRDLRAKVAQLEQENETLRLANATMQKAMKAKEPQKEPQSEEPPDTKSKGSRKSR